MEYKDLIRTEKNVSSSIKKLNESDKESLKSFIIKKYYDEEYGYKIIARDFLDCSYTEIRTIFKVLDIQGRIGTSITTNRLKSFRKNKAQNEAANKVGFRNPDLPRRNENTRTSIQGFYFNKGLNEYVWLRSSHEYVYAKFLDKHNIKWKIEVTHYTLSDGTTYRPDFFVYDDDWVLRKIVEIKGYYDVRAYKPALLQEQLQIEVILVNDITKYFENGRTYTKELKEWKLVKKSKEFVSNLSQ